MISSRYLDLLNMYGDNIETIVDQVYSPNETLRTTKLLKKQTPEPIKILKNLLDVHRDVIKTDGIDILIQKKPNLRIIGYAGVGKSTYIKANFNPHEYLLTAYTRISASQIDANTLSSIFKLGRFNENTINKSINSMKRYSNIMIDNIQKLNGIVIDEFYITPSAIVSKVDLICQSIRGCKEPFGGMQLILVGDDRQSEAVEDPFVESDLYKSLVFEEIILPEHENMRLTSEYMEFCNIFRNSKLNRRKMINLLKDKRFAKEEIKSDSYTVYYRNADVNRRNNEGMATFEGDVIYTRNNIGYKKGCPIYITGSSDGELCNGQMGFLKNKKGRKLIIEVDGEAYDVFPSKVEFKPGFAITIHLCQSKTWSGINIYLRKSDIMENRSLFIRLIYVALTRVRSFERCYININ